MLTEKDYCDYETCVSLKELGLSCDDIALRYEENPLACRYEDIPKPMLYEAQKFLREEKNIHIEVLYRSYIGWYEYFVCVNDAIIAEGDAFPSYEDALSTAIYMAVELLKEGK